MSAIFTIPFDFSPTSGISARLSEFIGDEKNQVVHKFDRFLSDCENNFESNISFHVDQISPLVLFGPSFTGKSCLGLAFANRISILLNQNPSDVLVLNLRDFCLEFAKAVQTKTTKDFRRRFDATRVILLDDLHHLANKKAACDEFQHLLDGFQANGQAVVVTSPTRPDATAGIGNRLASRLCDGLIIPLRLPGIESKRAIADQLEIKDISQLDLRTESVSFADICNFANHTAVGDEPAVKNQIEDESVINQIISSTAEKLDISIDDIIGASRMKTIALARCICIYLIRKKLNLSFQQIGKIFSNRDHSTIIHSYNKIQKIIEKPNQKQPDVVTLVTQVEQEISGCLKPVYVCS